MIQEVVFHLGVAKDIGELIDVLSTIPKDTKVSAAGGDCHIIYNHTKGYLVFDEKDYSEEWNED